MILLTLVILISSAWLLFRVIKIALTVTWCLAKIIACVLCVISLPLLIFLAFTAGGVILLLPLLLLLGAFAIIKAC